MQLQFENLYKSLQPNVNAFVNARIISVTQLRQVWQTWWKHAKLFNQACWAGRCMDGTSNHNGIKPFTVVMR